MLAGLWQCCAVQAAMQACAIQVILHRVGHQDAGAQLKLLCGDVEEAGATAAAAQAKQVPYVNHTTPYHTTRHLGHGHGPC